jgi:hypothetical protein
VTVDNPPFLDLDAPARRPLQVAILVCPGFAPADIVGLHTVLGILPGTTVHLVCRVAGGSFTLRLSQNRT